MYAATLFDLRGASSKDKEHAAEVFCQTIEAELGGAEAVIDAHRAYKIVFEKFGQTPLPTSANDAEKAVVAKWQNAESAGERAAFAGWNNLGGAHFELSY